jgi:hypothetical protein
MTVGEEKRITNITVIYHREIGDKEPTAISGMISTAESPSRDHAPRCGVPTATWRRAGTAGPTSPPPRSGSLGFLRRPASLAHGWRHLEHRQPDRHVLTITWSWRICECAR